LHCETISRRSREYQWEIQPHRHADLCQLLYVHKGQAQLEIEGQRSTLNEATLQVLPPLCVHGFHFSEDVEGYVVTLAAPLVSHLQAQLGTTVDGLHALGCYTAGKDSDYLNSLFVRLQEEYADEQPARDMMMHALVSVLLVWISRQAIQRRHPRAPRGQEFPALYPTGRATLPRASEDRGPGPQTGHLGLAPERDMSGIGGAAGAADHARPPAAGGQEAADLHQHDHQ
jgi:AraC family transcriptional activator of pobA